MSAFAFWPETGWALIRHFGRFLADEYRRTPAYRVLLKPIYPTEFPAPSFARPADTNVGKDILDGIWNFRGEIMRIDPDGNPWQRACPSRGFARDLHRFGWLKDLIACGDDGVVRAQTLVTQWVEEFGSWNTFSWRQELVAERLIAWLDAAPILFSGDAGGVCFDSFARQARHLRMTANRAAGAYRLKTLTANALMAATLAGDSAWLHKALTLLGTYLDTSLMSDGTPRDRNPSTAAETFFDLLALLSVLARLNLPVPEPLNHAITRLGGILRFFSHDDGGLALFQGGHEYTGAALNAAFVRAGIPAGHFSYAHEGGYQRASSGGGVLFMDVAPPARNNWSHQAHAGHLAFEYAYRGRRLIVNCGHGREGDWQDLSRLTAAHSTLTANDLSTSGVLPRGLRRHFLGSRMFGGPYRVQYRREDEEMHTWLDAIHDGYLKSFGLVHSRRLYLNDEGDDLRGEDTILWQRKKRPVDIALRFHLHPSVTATPTRDGQGVLLTDSTGEGWNFKSSARDVLVEPSIYLGHNGRPQKAEQIVLRSKARPSADATDPDNCTRWALSRAKG